MKKLTLAIASLAITLPFAESNPEPIKTIQALMQAAHAIGVFNGNVLVSQKGKVLYELSFGYVDATRSKPLTAGYVFYLGSITKVFNGSGIMFLQQQGKLQLSDKISRYLSGYPSWAESIQIGRLLNYTSGLPDVFLWRKTLA